MAHKEKFQFSGMDSLDVNITDCGFLLAAIKQAVEEGVPVACELCAVNDRSVVATVTGSGSDRRLEIVGRDACFKYREEGELDGTVK